MRQMYLKAWLKVKHERRTITKVGLNVRPKRKGI